MNAMLCACYSLLQQTHTSRIYHLIEAYVKTIYVYTEVVWLIGFIENIDACINYISPVIIIQYFFMCDCVSIGCFESGSILIFFAPILFSIYSVPFSLFATHFKNE